MTLQSFDVIIIGASMSGLAAGIRSAMFGKKTLILEQHIVAGGLNSYYQRGKRLFDVGLHAMTNFVPKEAKGYRSSVLGKVLKQLRIPFEEWNLIEQNFSTINFPNAVLTFKNGEGLKLTEAFVQFQDEFDALVEWVKNFPDLDLLLDYQSARGELKKRISSPSLIEMILCPLMIYGSAWENDMDLGQFIIMFRSIYLEGFMRPKGGVRTIIHSLMKKFEEVGGMLRFSCGVKEILSDGRVVTTTEEVIHAKKILSTIGYPETLKICKKEVPEKLVGQMTFVECIMVFKRSFLQQDLPTVSFYNNSDEYHYRNPHDFYDEQSAVVCFPLPSEEEAMGRVTLMANYNLWCELFQEEGRAQYNKKKIEVYAASFKILKKYIPELEMKDILFVDVFTPRTIARYTSRMGGAVYGSGQKIKSGILSEEEFGVKNLFLAGTDQGYLGIMGSMLSGISVANHELL